VSLRDYHLWFASLMNSELSTADSDASTRVRQTWIKVGIRTFPLIVLLVALYWETVYALASQWWNDPDYSHGFFVPTFSLFLIYRQRHNLKMQIPRGSWSGLLLLLMGIAALLLGHIGAEYFLTRSSLIIVIAGLVLLHLGFAIFRALAFPLAYLIFMVPLPAIIYNAVAFPLRGVAAQMATWFLHVLGVPVLLQGNIIQLSKLSLDVVEACSGIRSLMSLVALAAAWSYLSLKSWWARSIMILSAVPIAIGANVVRLVVSAIMGEYFGFGYAEGFGHTFFGLLVFLVAVMGLFLVSFLLRLVEQKVDG
jgi:exosortase